MLRITPYTDGDSIVLKLEGKLLEPWLDELRNVCGESKGAKLDLTSVTYVDAAGTAFLRALRSEGFTIVACSKFVAALLNVEMP